MFVDEFFADSRATIKTEDSTHVKVQVCVCVCASHYVNTPLSSTTMQSSGVQTTGWQLLNLSGDIS
jgi:hypothetical protein